MAWDMVQAAERRPLDQKCAKEPRRDRKIRRLACRKSGKGPLLRLQENSMSLLLQRTRFLSGGLAEVQIVTRQDIVTTLKLIKK